MGGQEGGTMDDLVVRLRRAALEVGVPGEVVSVDDVRELFREAALALEEQGEQLRELEGEARMRVARRGAEDREREEGR